MLQDGLRPELQGFLTAAIQDQKAWSVSGDASNAAATLKLSASKDGQDIALERNEGAVEVSINGRRLDVPQAHAREMFDTVSRHVRTNTIDHFRNWLQEASESIEADAKNWKPVEIKRLQQLASDLPDFPEKARIIGGYEREITSGEFAGWKVVMFNVLVPHQGREEPMVIAWIHDPIEPNHWLTTLGKEWAEPNRQPVGLDDQDAITRILRALDSYHLPHDRTGVKNMAA
ncbi:MAG: hypothetical protein K1X79_13575 [Oligoflexia bacterium]|nr:hypothetical protein [Oligoflexia bacterium]